MMQCCVKARLIKLGRTLSFQKKYIKIKKALIFGFDPGPE